MKKQNITLPDHISSGGAALINKERNFGEVDIVARDAINDILLYLKIEKENELS